ncbi:MAG: HD domain-containing protein [Pirellulaceae bacterium]
MDRAEQLVDRLCCVYRERGERHYGENVSEREHALQTAHFARQFGEADAIVVACLLHDVGHLLHDLGEHIANAGVDARHEDLGADALRGRLPDVIVEPIRLHVTAKRYLCWKDPRYLAGLSPASRLSLELQGGVMSDDEAHEFERHPHFDGAVRVRRYDDMGKVAGLETDDFDSYRELICQFARASG